MGFSEIDVDLPQRRFEGCHANLAVTSTDYRDGIDAALRGDPGARLDWLIDQEERMNAALERATILLSGLPDRPEDEYSPPSEMAIPTGGQRLGLSSRGF
jgi:hypothetical protein